MKKHIAIPILFLLLLTIRANGQPDFNSVVTANGIRFYGDVAEPRIFYYPPADLALGISPQGKPDFKFIMMRYSSSSVYGEDNQSIRYKNMLTMRIVLKRIGPDSLRTAQKELRRLTSNASIRPLPVSQIEAMIAFVPIGEPDSAAIIRKGEVATETKSGYTTSATYWEERYFTIFLDNYSAMFLLHALQNDMSAISFMYAFHSKGVTNKKILDVTGRGKSLALLQKQFAQDSNLQTSAPVPCIVKAGAFGIYIDTSAFSDLIIKSDISDTFPPGYAVINVRNYDFANHLREDLYEKAVDLEATGAGGNKVNLSVNFHYKNPDATSANFRFPFAVRVDKPYRYRVRELNKDGHEIKSEWKEADTWSGVLDITTREQ